MHPPRAIPVVRSLDFPAGEDGGECPAGGVHAVLLGTGGDVLVGSEGVDSLDEGEGAMDGGEREEEEGERAERAGEDVNDRGGGGVHVNNPNPNLGFNDSKFRTFPAISAQMAHI